MRTIALETKRAIVKQALTRPNNKTIRDIAKENNVGHSSLNKWIRELSPEPSSQLIDSETKLNHIIASAQLDETQLGVYCRKNGIYAHQLSTWKEEFMAPTNKQSDDKLRRELKLSRDENKLLKKELKRKEKALAETAALLVLKKKADSIWGGDEDD